MGFFTGRYSGAVRLAVVVKQLSESASKIVGDDFLYLTQVISQFGNFNFQRDINSKSDVAGFWFFAASFLSTLASRFFQEATVHITLLSGADCFAGITRTI